MPERAQQCVDRVQNAGGPDLQTGQENDRRAAIGQQLSPGAQRPEPSHFSSVVTHDDWPEGTCEVNSMPSRTSMVSLGFISLNSPSG